MLQVHPHQATAATTSFSWKMIGHSKAHVETWSGIPWKLAHAVGSYSKYMALTASCLLMCNGAMHTFHRYIHDISQYSKTEWLSFVYSQIITIPYIISIFPNIFLFQKFTFFKILQVFLSFFEISKSPLLKVVVFVAPYRNSLRKTAHPPALGESS